MVTTYTSSKNKNKNKKRNKNTFPQIQDLKKTAIWHFQIFIFIDYMSTPKFISFCIPLNCPIP